MKKKVFIAVLILFLGGIVSQIRFDIPAQEVEAKYKLPESKFVDVKGLRVHYTDEGIKKGIYETVVLLHGTAASLHTWQGWMPSFKKYFRVVRVDLPGFGLTGPSPQRDYSIKAYVKFLENFLSTLNIQKIYLVGNSLGGEIAWHYAALHPDDVYKLVLIDSAGLPRKGPIPLPFRLARINFLQGLVKYFSPRFLVKKSLKDVYFDKTKVSDSLVERYFTLTLREGNRQAFVDRANQIEDAKPDELRRVTSPTLILWGKHDAWIPVEQAEIFRKKIMIPQIKIYENAGHVPQEEIPEETLADVLHFLE
ncbi:MAG: 2-hydroxy-6-oxononadienedioate/2-hydroxy-6-oxononatrienedioate hydrolase [Turneriella sp.]|nr:2-hydroxy-6-oxononadienedioate/2-hydroxy-6-oxononatrienedioate hydrolase [Turneriella sp.]